MVHTESTDDPLLPPATSAPLPERIYHTFSHAAHLAPSPDTPNHALPDAALLIPPHKLLSLSPAPPASRDSASQDSPVLATLLVLMACAFFSGMHSSVRYVTMAYTLSPAFVVFFRGSLQATAAAALVALTARGALSPSPSPRVILLLALRGLLGAVSILSKFTSLAIIPVAIASSLFSTTPIFAAALAWLFLAEHLTSVDRIALVLTTVASVLVATSETSVAGLAATRATHVVGVVLALNGAVMTGLVFVIMRHMGTRVHFLLSVFTTGVGSSLGSITLYSLQVGSLTTTMHHFTDTLMNASRGLWLGLFAVFFFGFMAALCINRGVQMLPAGRSSLLRTCDIPMNFLVGYLVLGEFPHSPGQLIGCTMIAFSMILLAAKARS